MFIKNKAQASIYIIIAIGIAVLILLILFIRSNVEPSVPSEFDPIYQNYKYCIEEYTKEAIDTAGTQGGRIFLDEYVPGSDYAPFSNHLNFFGIPVGYWYYQSANGLVKENVPALVNIENDIEKYVLERLSSCDFESFYAEGYELTFEEPEVSVSIDEERVSVNVDSDLLVAKGEDKAIKSNHEAIIESKFGKFYNLAKEIYSFEKRESFLENYTIDVLRNYAPVDGVEISCNSKIWKTRDVANELRNALSANIAAIKFRGSYYTLNDPLDKYFVVNLDSDENINLMYNPDWSSKITIDGEGVDDELMVTSPVGNQEGLGVIGFCYAPYHFIYDISYPVLVQIYSEDELFQFPIAVIIDNNIPRQADYSESFDLGVEDVCKYKNQEVEINLYDINLNRVDGKVTYSCLGQECTLGETKEGKLNALAPTCYNGELIIKSQNYSDKKQIFSTNEQNIAEVILDREHEVDVMLNLDGKEFSSGSAVVTFSEMNGSKIRSAVFPESSKLKLSEGYYEVSVYVYSNSSLVIPATKKTQCTQVASGGISAFFGGTKEECFDIEIPETKIEQALVGGGKSYFYIYDSNLEPSKLNIFVNSLPKPNSVDDLSNNFVLFESKEVEIEFG